MAGHLDELIHSGRLPLYLLFAAFLITFVVTRIITRLIRSGRGPFRDNVVGGVHIHHAVPGLLLLVVGAVVSVAVNGVSPAAEGGAVLIGIGMSLVFDEFALILHLRDVYWAREGQLSVQVVTLTLAFLGLLLLGYAPFDADSGWLPAHTVLVVGVPTRVVAILICVAKGKFSTAVLGVLVPIISVVGALRLARPESRWSRRFYSDAKLERARRRADRFDGRFGRWGLSLEDLVAGAPTAAPEAPPTTSAVTATSD